MTEPSRVAVAVIHGMGSQGADEQGVDDISFSAGLRSKLKAHMGAELWDTQIVYREIFWADILQGRQQDYLDAITGQGARWRFARDFVMHRLTDAAGYRKTHASTLDPETHEDARTDIYRRIHDRVAATIARLEEVAGPDVPLLIFAHSLGGHVISNYVYDMQVSREVVRAGGDFQRLQTMAGFLTFGCNIPVFTFAYPPERVTPITYPGTAIPAAKRLHPWWRNLNARSDVLGMPLGPAGDKYGRLVEAGHLEDRWITVGNWLTAWTPLSHTQYWTDRDFYKHAARMIDEALAIGRLPT